jgi:hypothetical protein
MEAEAAKADTRSSRHVAAPPSSDGMHESMPGTTRSMLRYVAAGIFPIFRSSSLALVAMVAIAHAACVDPQNDYAAFIVRTAEGTRTVDDASIDSASPDDDASIDSAGPVNAFSGQYVMACVSQVSDSDPKDATYFVVTATFKPAASGAGGTFDYTDQALMLGPGSPPAPPASISEGVGAIVTVNGSVVTPDGRCDVVFGPTVVPGSADAVVPGQDIDFTTSTLHFIIGPRSHLCAELSGTVVSPLDIDSLTPSLNICALSPTTGPVVPLTQADVHCP